MLLHDLSISNDKLIPRFLKSKAPTSAAALTLMEKEASPLICFTAVNRTVWQTRVRVLHRNSSWTKLQKFNVKVTRAKHKF